MLKLPLIVLLRKVKSNKHKNSENILWHVSMAIKLQLIINNKLGEQNTFKSSWAEQEQE